MAEHRVLVRVQMPDRPGALGLVASRVGAVKGDIVGIEVVDRTAGEAIDELAVVLPDASLLGALRREISEVDGSEVESLVSVAAFPEPRLDAWRTAARLVAAHGAGDLPSAFVRAVHTELRADWCALTSEATVISATPTMPPFGIAELRHRAAHSTALGDATLLVGRERALRRGELDVLDALTALVKALAARRENPTRSTSADQNGMPWTGNPA